MAAVNEMSERLETAQQQHAALEAAYQAADARSVDVAIEQAREQGSAALRQASTRSSHS